MFPDYHCPMNNKGVQAAIVGGILALIIIALMFSLTTPGKQIVRQILGITPEQFIPQSNFTPYTGPQFSDDEVRTINSINAITCALNAMMSDTFDLTDKTICNTDKTLLPGQSRPLDSTTPAGAQTIDIEQAGTTITFGETSVTCNEPPLTLRAATPQSADELAALVLDCWNKFENNDFENVWCNYIDASGIQGVTEHQFFDALNAYSDLGDDLAGAITSPHWDDWPTCNFVLAGEEYEWYDDGPEGIGCAINVNAFVLCGDNAGANEIHISRDLNKCIPTGIELLANQVTAEELVSKTCDVTNFQLPQRIDGDWKDYMRGHGDPSFVLYYEAFPQGEEEAWIVDTQEHYFTNAIVLNVAFAALPLAGKLAKYATYGAGRLFASAGTATIRIMGRTGQAIAVNTAGKLIKSAGNLVLGLRAYHSVASAAARSRAVIISGAHYAGAAGKYVIADTAHFITKFKQADTILSRGTAANPAVLREIAEESLQATSARAVLNEATAGALISNPAAKEQLARELGQGGEAFTNTLLFKNADDMFTTLHQIMKNGKTDDEILAALTRVYPHTISRALLEGAQSKQAAEVLEEAATNPQIRQEAQQFAAKYGAAGALARQGTVHSLAYAAAVLQALADSQNNKFVPIGINTLGMHRPYEIPLTTDTSDLFNPLAPALRKKFIALEKDTFGNDLLSRAIRNQGISRFFLASPCYGDITIEHQMCQCAQPETDFTLVNFGAGAQPVQTSSIDRTERDPYQYAVKECISPTAFERSAFSGSTPVIATQCLTAHVTLDESKDQNFCYSGAHELATVGKGAILGASIAGSVAVTMAFCAVPPGIGCIGAVAGNIAIDSLAGFLTQQINEATKWPAH